ncbi:MAG: asparagine synthetase B family protein [Methylococcales bacterium]
MPSVFGWLGQPPAEIHVRDLLGINPDPESHFKSNTGGLLKAEGKIVQLEGFLVACSGQPYWKSSEFDSISKQEGHEVAILRAHQAHGKVFLRLLGGEFWLAILNPEQNKALIAIDRIGIQRLAYSNLRGFAFSDSVACLKQYIDGTAELSKQSLYEYLYFHMIPSPDSIYQGIKKLGPAQFLEYRNGALVIGEYWEPVFVDEGNQSPAQLAAELRATLSTAVAKRMNGAHIGAFLSGGLDSSTVTGYMSEIGHQAVPTYTIGFDAKGYDETEYAKIAADHFGTRHVVKRLSRRDVLDAIPRVAAAYDEPFGNSSAIPTYYCAQRAREDGIETLLAGDGGDELFAGNERYATQMLFEHYGCLPAALTQGLERICRVLPGINTLPVLKKMNSYIRQAKIPLPERMEYYNYLHQHDVEEIFDPEFLKEIDRDAPLAHLRNYFNKVGSASKLNRMLYLDWKRTLADNDLRKVNEMCKLAGIKVAYPMLDDDLIDLSLRIPGKLKLKRGKLRYFYKFALKDFLPEKILNKSKHGFGLPFGVWTRIPGELQDFAYAQVNNLKSRGFLNGSFLDRAIRLHRDDHAAYYGELIWILMILETWLSHHHDSN